MNQQASVEPDDTPAGGGAIGSWVLAATILASSMAFIDGSALSVALPAIQSDLSASGVQLLWIVNAYLLMLAAFILVSGALGDRLGRKKVFMAGIGLFLFGSLSCGLSPSADFLVGARVVQGLGGALMIPGSLAIIAAFFPPRQRGKAIGTWSAATTIVIIAGPILGGLLAEAGLWRGVFLINLPLGLISLAILYFKVQDSDAGRAGRIDYWGAALIAIGLGALTYGFVAAPDYGFGEPRIYGALALGVAALVAFIAVEARSCRPMMPLGVFRSRTFSGTNLLTLFLYGALNVVALFFPLNLVQAQGYNPAQAGLAFIPFALLIAGLSRWAGALADRFGPRLPLLFGPFMAGLGFLFLAFAGLTDGPSSYWTTFLPGIFCAGVGMGFTVAPLTTAVMSALPTEYVGTASGINNSVARTAGVLAIAIVGAVSLLTFSQALTDRTAPIDISPEARSALQLEASKLGEAAVPAEVAAEQAPMVERAIKLAFTDTYRRAMLICAGLAWLSVIMSALLVEPRLRPATAEELKLGEGQTNCLR